MSILGLFDIGRSALYASQSALMVTSNNIANMNTPGFSKEDIILTVSNPGVTGSFSTGRGVTVDGVRRSYDKFVQAQLLGQGQNQGKSAAMDSTWGQVEQVFNEAKGAGLSSALTDYFNAWNDVAANPSSQSARMVLLQRAKTLVTQSQAIEKSVVSTVDNANADIQDSARQVNTLAAGIAQLNGAITRAESGVGLNTANDLRNQRDQKMNELSKLTDYSSFEDTTGAVSITVGMRALVTGSRTNAITTARNSASNQDLYLDGINITANLQGGKIGGLIAARNDIQSTALPGLRRLVASITQQVNIVHQAGYGLDTSNGIDFFAPLQATATSSTSAATIDAVITDQTALTLDEYAITFDSGGNYTVANKQTGAQLVPPVTGPYASGSTISLPGIDVVITGTVTAADSFTVSPIATAVSGFSVTVTDPRSIAASTDVTALPGDNRNAIQVAQLADTMQANLSNATYSSYYSGIVATVGVMKQTAGDSLTFDNNLLAALQSQRDSISGVSLDEEAANLVRYQRSYQAGARMITVADELLQTVLQL